jgi:hypothetical protein
MLFSQKTYMQRSALLLLPEICLETATSNAIARVIYQSNEVTARLQTKIIIICS